MAILWGIKICIMYALSQKEADHYYFYDNFGKLRQFSKKISQLKFRKDQQRKLELKLPPLLKSVATLSTLQLYSTASSVQSDAKTFNCSNCFTMDAFSLFLSTQINLPHVFKMFVFGTYACSELCTPLVNGSDALNVGRKAYTVVSGSQHCGTAVRVKCHFRIFGRQWQPGISRIVDIICAVPG